MRRPEPHRIPGKALPRWPLVSQNFPRYKRHPGEKLTGNGSAATIIGSYQASAAWRTTDEGDTEADDRFGSAGPRWPPQLLQ
jgi:hypothetical protein